MDDEIEFTEEEAEMAIMGYKVTGKLPQFWTKGTLASAYLVLAAANEREIAAQRKEDLANYQSEQMLGVKTGLDQTNDPDFP
jgi:hypothetical protein